MRSGRARCCGDGKDSPMSVSLFIAASYLRMGSPIPNGLVVQLLGMSPSPRQNDETNKGDKEIGGLRYDDCQFIADTVESE